MNIIKKLMQMWMQLPDIQVFSDTTIWDDTDPKLSHTRGTRGTSGTGSSGHTGGLLPNKYSLIGESANDYIEGRWSGL